MLSLQHWRIQKVKISIRGFSAEKYNIRFQCDDDGTIITDGAGLIDIRSSNNHPHDPHDHRDCHPRYHHNIGHENVLLLPFRFGGEGPKLAVLDSTDLMCPGKHQLNMARINLPKLCAT